MEDINLIRQISSKMSEDVALVLTHLYQKSVDVNLGTTVAMIMQNTNLDKNKVRLALLLLETSTFVDKIRDDRCWVYTISKNGKEALHYLLDKNEYPGRTIKFAAVLNIPESMLSSLE